MKKLFVLSIVVLTVILFTSCARGVNPERAAKGGMKCGKNYIK